MGKPQSWWRPSGRRPSKKSTSPSRSRRARFEPLEARRVLSAPSMTPIGDVGLLGGAPLWIALDGVDPDGGTLTFTATSDNPNVTLSIPEGNRSMRISVASEDGTVDGDMVLELFENLVPRVTGHIITLAESGFYDGVIFHRVIDDFMIQTGDPTGTGEGGSYLGEFDDQFNVDLQHTGTGVLSMAKSNDDTNDSQFFITEGPTRWLDFNHSIFGQLIEGEDIREAISEVGTDANDRPNSDVYMESVEIFYDTENAVMMLKAPEGYTGGANITITITDELGHQYVQQPFHVSVTPDTTDGDPYLENIPEVRTTVDTPVTFQLEPVMVDAEGDGAYYLGTEVLDYYDMYDPFWSHEDLTCAVDFNTGAVTVTPSNGLVGIHPVTVGTALYQDAVDYQVVPIFIVPDVAPTSTLDMALVRDATTVDEFGEVAALPDDQWIDEWDEFTIEIWATIDGDGQFGVHTVSTDLVYDANLFTATEIEYGTAFTQNQTGLIVAAAGRVNDIGGTTRVFTIDEYTGPPDLYPSRDPDDLNLFGDDVPVLVARVHFAPNLAGSGVPMNADSGYPTPITDLGFTFENAEIKWSSVDLTTVTAGSLQTAELWPVLYDIDSDGQVTLGDLSYFAIAYGHSVGDPWTWASDFDHDGTIGLGDLSYFAANYQRTGASTGRSVYASNFPSSWSTPAEGAAPTASTTLAASQFDLALADALYSSQETLKKTIEPLAVDLLLKMWDE
jgi:cyclophilin family peptidyl-prolyl cis-trans isomerase